MIVVVIESMEVQVLAFMSDDIKLSSVFVYRYILISEFNAVIRLCVTSIYPYLSKIMNLPTTSVTKKHIESSKKWLAVKNIVRVYINDLVKVL